MEIIIFIESSGRNIGCKQGRVVFIESSGRNIGCKQGRVMMFSCSRALNK